MHTYGTPRVPGGQHFPTARRPAESAPDRQVGLEHIGSILTRVSWGIEARAGSPIGLACPARPSCLRPSPPADHPEHSGGPGRPSEALPCRESGGCSSVRSPAGRKSRAALLGETPGENR